MLKTAGAVLIAAAFLAGCGGSQSPSADASSGADAADAHSEVAWSYTGSKGPDEWGSLSPDYEACSTGTRQSPISIEQPPSQKRPQPRLDYAADQDSEVSNNGHSVQALAGPGSSLTVGKKKYELQYMHFHTPAETVVEGVTNPVELHFVHENAAGDYAVFALFLKEGAENPGLQPFIDTMSLPVEGDTITTLSWADMAPKTARTVRFDGSLTTPGCDEGLSWLVAVDPVEASAEQIDAFRAAYDGNARPVQPVNGRKVTIDAE